MESITTFAEAIEFVNQFVDIHDFVYDIPTSTADLKAAGFVQRGSILSLNDQNYKWDDDLPEGVVLYSMKSGSYVYSVCGVRIKTKRNGARYNSMFSMAGLNFDVFYIEHENGPPEYTSVVVDDIGAGVTVRADCYITKITSPFVDIDNRVLTCTRKYRNGTLFGTVYEYDGSPHCVAGPASISPKREEYWLLGHLVKKSEWLRFRLTGQVSDRLLAALYSDDSSEDDSSEDDSSDEF